MQLVRLGNRGINFDNVATWTASLDPDSEEDREILRLVFVGGGSVELRDEEAIAFRQWLERKAEDLSKGPPSNTLQIG